jgi:hypothetical protein
MMVSAITSATRTDPTTASSTGPLAKSATSSQQATQSNPQSTTSTLRDTVQISNAAQAALKEVTETQAQTAKEASSGDHQAQRLLAIEAAARKA